MKLKQLILITAVVFTPILFFNCLENRKSKSPKIFVWMGEGENHSDEYLKKQFNKLKKAGVNGVMYQCSVDRYPNVIKIADRTGLEIHAWQVILNCRDEYVMKNHKDWFTINGRGKSTLDNPPFVDYYKWLCPSNEQVQDYLIEKVSKLGDIEGLKGIHLDYIRYSDVILPKGLWSKYNLVMDREYPEFDFCYCDVCRDNFKAQTGIDPSELQNPSMNKEWKQYRYNSITHLVNKLSDAAHRKGKQISAAVFPTPTIAKKIVRQDWVNWNLDMVYPMVYHNFYEKDVNWIKDAVKEGVDALKGKMPLFSGLYIPKLTSDELAEAIKYAFESGAQGICLFGYEKMNEEHWKKFYNIVKKYN